METTNKQAETSQPTGQAIALAGTGRAEAGDVMTSAVAIQAEADLQQMAAYADLPMDIEAELDQRTMAVRELLSLAPGSVVRLTRSAGENVDVRVNGARIGFGEIVILENKVGVRITDFEIL
jgi:flagellar motor switch protein FliN